MDVSIRAYELDHFFAASLELLCMIDFAGHLHRPNPQWDQVLGYEPQDLEGVMFLDLVHPDDRPMTAAAFADLSNVGVSANFINRFQASDGSYRSMEWFARPGGDMIYASARDVTMRESLGRALQESEDRYRLIAQNTNDVIVLMDTDTMTMEYVSPSMQRLTGFPAEELSGQTLAALLTPYALKKVVASTNSQRAASEQGDTEAGHYLIETEFLRKEGGSVPVELSVKVLMDEEGKARKHVSVCRDVSARKEAERALREGEERYRLIADNVADVIWVYDLALERFLFISPSVERLRGFSVEEAMAQSIEQAVLPSSFPKVVSALRDGLARAGAGEFEPEALEIRQPCRDGRAIDTEVIVKLLPGPDGLPVQLLGVSRDVTARNAAETALRESRKRLEDLMFVVGDWIWEADPEYRYTQCSEGVRAVLGYEPAEVIGKRPWDFMTWPSEPREMRAYAGGRTAERAAARW